jgi:tyrosine-protein phosphatase SIW14
MSELVAPDNFAMVESGIYRSAFPRPRNTRFLSSLGLKCIVCLVPEDYPEDLVHYYESKGIVLKQIGLEGNKWLNYKCINTRDLITALSEVVNPSNHPVLVHCNKGMHRTGSLIGCLRKLRRWSLAAIFSEYVLYADSRARQEDQVFIENFNVDDFSEFYQHES